MINQPQPASLATNPSSDSTLIAHFKRVRLDTVHLCEPLETEDYGIQTVAEVSPPKWHLAHTAWFFETLLLKPFLQGYSEYHPLYNQLFNSYYDTIGPHHARPERGLLSRPTVKEVYAYRTYVEQQMLNLLQQQDHQKYQEIVQRTLLGLNHEQQHQELLLTDIKHIFAYNPLRPVYQAITYPPVTTHKPLSWVSFDAGIKHIGHRNEGFAYDNEGPSHPVYINAFKLASRPVTNREYLQFMQDGGYAQSDYWLSDGWQKQQGSAPLYWEQRDNEWWHMTLSGMRPIDLDAPVCHVNFYEAAAYARYVNKRLPTEAEWEIAARNQNIGGNLSESRLLHPVSTNMDTPLQQLYGDVWEWTQSTYSAYPGYHQLSGPLGEYNGKFMSNQMVLRGGSCVTPSDHIRATYRNFFYPHERWQFCGFRLAEDI